MFCVKFLVIFIGLHYFDILSIITETKSTGISSKKSVDKEF
jgi:hypothetical protein